MSRRARRRQPPPDLTSLFDVLFIVIFATLIRAAAVQSAAAHPAPPAPPKPESPPVKLEVAQLHAQAVASVTNDVSSRPAVIARISEKGSLTSIETTEKTEPLDSPLLEHSPDPDVALAYLGDRAAELRICRIVAVHLGAADLSHHLVILAPEKPLADLPHALVEGLRRDVERCLHDQQGLAVIVDPSSVGAAAGSAGSGSP